MAKDLVKLARVTFTSAVPAVPYQPSYRVRTSTGYWATTYVITTYVSSSGGSLVTLHPMTVWVDTSRWVTMPAVPGRAAVPPTVSSDAMKGWNSGAVSGGSLLDDGGWRFRVPVTTAGTIVGLAPDNYEATPNQITHGLFVSFNEVQVWEAGVLSGAHANDGSDLVLRRDGGVVTASGDGWSHTYASASLGVVVLDAALYVAGDAVTDPSPEIVCHLAVPMSMPAMRFSDGASWSDLAAPALLPAPAFIGVTGEVGSLAAPALLPVMRFASGTGWADLAVPVPMPVPMFEAGLPEVAINTLLVPLAMPGMAMRGVTGEVGDLVVPVPMPVMRMADATGWADMAVPLPMPTPFFRSRESKPWSNAVADTTAHFASCSSLARTISYASSTLRRSASAASSERAVLAASSTLHRGGSARSGGPISIAVSATLRRRGAAPAPVTHQVCTNVATGAVSLFTGMQFDGFVTSQRATYGWRHDGVYSLGPTETPVDVRVDLGVSDLGAAQSKSVPMVIVDVAADVPPQVELAADGRSLRYDTGDIGTGYRASTAKAEAGRDWRVTIHAAQVTRFDLQAVEIQFAPLWRKGRAR